MSNTDLARNHNTPPEILDRLSYDESWIVREGVALNPNTPPETLEQLANDGGSWIRYCVAYYNPNTPQYILDLIKFKNYLKYYE
jgi:hypothetical protein